MKASTGWFKLASVHDDSNAASSAPAGKLSGLPGGVGALTQPPPAAAKGRRRRLSPRRGALNAADVGVL